MKYSFEPITTRVSKNNHPKYDLNFNFNTYNGCNVSHGIYILFQITINKIKFTLCIKPIGEITFKQ